MEKITDPVEIRDYNENGFVEFVAYKQPGYPGEWYGHFAFKDGESGQFIFTARKNSISFGDNTNTEHKYIYAETGAAQEPYIRYNVAGQYWEIYPTLGGGPGGPPGPILAEHTLLQNDIHTDTVTATPVEGDLIVANATPKWARFAKGAANQLLGVQASGATLEWKNIASLVSAGAGINVSGAATITISNTGVLSVNAMTGAISIIGTTNQVNVSSGGGTVTLSLPQNIHTAATPTFAGITFASGIGNNIPITFISGASVVGEILYAGINSPGARYFGILTRNADGFRIFTNNSSGSPTQRLVIPNGDNVSVQITGGLVAGSGNVPIIGSDGRIPALTSTYLSSLDASQLVNTLTVRKNSVGVGTRRQINFQESSGLVWSVTDTGSEIAVKATAKRVLVLPIPGDPNAGAPVSVKIAAPTSGTITAIKHVCTVAASTTYTYDVNKNGTTIYTTQANRPTRTSAHGTNLVTAATPDVTGFSENDIFSIDLDEKGTGVKDVVFFIFYTET